MKGTCRCVLWLILGHSGSGGVEGFFFFFFPSGGVLVDCLGFFFGGGL